MAKFIVLTNPLTTLRSWTNLLRNLTFTDNFKGSEWVGRIEPLERKTITHNLGAVPQRFIVTECYGSMPVGEISERKFTSTQAYFYNPSSTQPFVGKILFLP